MPALELPPARRGRGDPPIRVATLETAGLGNHSHIATDGAVAVVVDPRETSIAVSNSAAASVPGSPGCWRPTSTTIT